jgi:phosphatidylserine/phosphatidylglycerophosphate/cardiolipin synthase-like enzyme
MHQKFAVIDRRVVLTGSYIWTQSAENFDDENVLLFRDARPLADEYRKEFIRL